MDRAFRCTYSPDVTNVQTFCFDLNTFTGKRRTLRCFAENWTSVVKEFAVIEKQTQTICSSHFLDVRLFTLEYDILRIVVGILT